MSQGQALRFRTNMVGNNNNDACALSAYITYEDPTGICEPIPNTQVACTDVIRLSFFTWFNIIIIIIILVIVYYAYFKKKKRKKWFY